MPSGPSAYDLTRCTGRFPRNFVHIPQNRTFDSSPRTVCSNPPRSGRFYCLLQVKRRTASLGLCRQQRHGSSPRHCAAIRVSSHKGICIAAAVLRPICTDAPYALPPICAAVPSVVPPHPYCGPICPATPSVMPLHLYCRSICTAAVLFRPISSALL